MLSGPVMGRLIRSKTIFSAFVADCDLLDCSIFALEIRRCRLLNCRIHASRVVNCRIGDGILDCNENRCNIIAKKEDENDRLYIRHQI